jgi:heme/copper-type cytochrome/quinol oxidase subunit 2
MDIFIAISVAIVAIVVGMLLFITARFENTKSTEFRRLEAERERKWLNYHTGWKDPYLP